MKRLFAIGCLAILSANIASSALAHSGRTDASGCHNNRRTGDYHCHGGGSSGGSSSGSSSPSPTVYQTPRYEQDRSRSREVDPNAVCPYSNASGYNATVAEEVNLRSGPSTESGIITTLAAGINVKVHSGQGENERLWGWLTTEGGQDGWASMRYVACID